MVAPHDFVLAGECPVCGKALAYARSLAPEATLVISNRVMSCTCGAQFVLNTGIVRGEAKPINTEIIPLAGGDSGGAGALFLD